MAARGLFGVPRTNDQAVDGLLSGWHWNVSTLTYSFPALGSFYEYGPERATFGAFNSAQKSAATQALRAITSFTEASFTKVLESSSVHGDMRFGESQVPLTAYAVYPGLRSGGDAWFNPRDYNAPQPGNFAHHTIFHEIGHTMGLKHPHERDSFGRTPKALDSIEFSVMSYHSYVGSHIRFLTYAEDSAPQTFMMLDIAALQQMYGADFSFRASDTVYRFSPSTGQMFVNGTATPDGPGDTIFRTIWEGGGTDTLDLRGFAKGMSVDLLPGRYSGFSRTQLADLGDNHLARGNLFNALLYNEDARSLLENVLGGKGRDFISGNQADNQLDGNGGGDWLDGRDGNDLLRGGSGIDRLVGRSGDDQLFGGSENDELIGGEGADYLDGGTGTDTLEGGSGDDRLRGGIGDETMFGDDPGLTLFGNDHLDGGPGADLLRGGLGDDVLVGGLGDDILDGSAGIDTAVYELAAADYEITAIGSQTTVRNLATGEVDTLNGIDTMQFSDGPIPI